MKQRACSHTIPSIDRVIRKEIKWCKDNPMVGKVTPEFRKGFIKGLEQALYLSKQVGK